ncbi:hypothetical protein QEN19_002762 [Hanseniaspora menglaensis]
MHGIISKNDLLPRYIKNDNTLQKSNLNTTVFGFFKISFGENSFIKRNKLLKKLKHKQRILYGFVLCLFLTVLVYRFVFSMESSSLVTNTSPSVGIISKQGSSLVTEDAVLNTYEDDDMKDSKLNMERAKQILLNQLYAKEQMNINAEKSKDSIVKASTNGNDITALKQSDDSKKNKNENTNAGAPFKKNLKRA